MGQFLTAGQSYYREVAQEFIPDIGYNTAWNNEYVSAALPELQVYMTKGGSDVQEDLPVTMAVTIPGANKYSWTSGNIPAVDGSYVGWQFSSPPDVAQVNNGISLPAQDSATKLIFIAGALLGIAGGALVGAIQEAVRSET